MFRHTSFEDGDLLEQDVQMHHIIQESGGFVPGRVKICCPQFQKLILYAATCEGEQRIRACEENKVHLWRQMPFP